MLHIVTMWQFQIEIENYSASVKDELTVLIKSLELPTCAQVLVLFVASTHESAFTLGRYIEYACGTIDTRQCSTLCISSLRWLQTWVKHQQ